MSWTRVMDTTTLKNDEPHIFRYQGKPICLWRRDDHVFAFDNRCPHEGYPLKAGDLDGRCVLTCFWHNWKFDLMQAGRNLHERDRLRTYPVREKNGHIEVDLSEPDAASKRQLLLASLKGAFKERQYGRLARTLARFQFEGLAVDEALKTVIHWSHDKLEFGMTHAFAVAPDWLQLADESCDEHLKLTYFTEMIDHFAYDVLRQPVFPYNNAVVEYSATALDEAIEAEDEPRAQAILNSAAAKGLKLAQLLPNLAQSILRHYRSFGHALIYLTKIEALVVRLGEDLTYPLLRPLVRYTCSATREDLLPEFRHYGNALETLHNQSLMLHAGRKRLTMPHGLSVKDALTWAVEALGSHNPLDVHSALITALARNMLHYDTRFESAVDLPVTRNFNWLFLTHGITTANAVRKVARLNPALWRSGLLQVACFVGRAKSYLMKNPQVDPAGTVNFATFWDNAAMGMADHGYDNPIYPCHHVKTACAVREERAVLPEKDMSTVLTGLSRFLNAAMKTKHGLRLARQAQELVGKDYVQHPPSASAK